MTTNSNLIFLNKTINGEKMDNISDNNNNININSNQNNIYSINDFNNYLRSNRKLIINDNSEYWVHDSLLIQSSELFNLLFNKEIKETEKEVIENTKNKVKYLEEEIKTENTTIIKSFITIPVADYFFDILLWIYSKDNERLVSLADDADSFLNIISLGIELDLKPCFFDILINGFQDYIDENLFSHHLWSRFYISFKILIKIIYNILEKYNDNDVISSTIDNNSLINRSNNEGGKTRNISNSNNFNNTNLTESKSIIINDNSNKNNINNSLLQESHRYKDYSKTIENKLEIIEKKDIKTKQTINLKVIIALLSWLKEDTPKNLNDTALYKDLELFTSIEFQLVQNFIRDNKVMEYISVSDLNIIKRKFPELIPALNNEFLIQKHIIKQIIKISCLVCKRVSNNIQEFNLNSCEVKYYHPKPLITLQRQLNQHNLNCDHENCKKKLNVNEYPCCHKGQFYEGCLLNDGKHILVFEEK